MSRGDEFATDKVKIGGEPRERVILEQTNEDGTPCLYAVKIKGYRKKDGRPNDQGEPTSFYSWSFELLEGDNKGKVIWGMTNDEARRSYKDQKPLKLLQLLMAVRGRDVEKEESVALADLIGKPLRVEVEVKEKNGEKYLNVIRYFQFKGELPKDDDVPVIEIEADMGDEPGF